MNTWGEGSRRKCLDAACTVSRHLYGSGAFLQGVACASDGALHDAVCHAVGQCQVSAIDEREDCDAEADILDDA